MNAILGEMNQDEDAAIDGIIDASLEMARKDAAIRRELKAAIERNDVAETLRFARELVGLEPIEDA